MSLAKEQMEYEERMYSCAKEILVNIGEIKFCDCGNTFYQMYINDKGEIYDLATKKLKEKYGNQHEYKTFRNAIQKVLNEAHVENDCPYCKLEE